jgi:hypothetical protein
MYKMKDVIHQPGYYKLFTNFLLAFKFNSKMMSSRQIYSLVHFDGWVMPDRIEQGSTYRAWTNMNKAVKKGALWGDFAVYTAQELYEALEDRANYRRMYKSDTKEPDTKEPDTKEPVLEELVQVVERSEPSALTSFETYPEPEPVKEPVKEQFKQPRPQKQTLSQKLEKFVKTPPRPLCLGCGMYCVNSKPPDSWSAGDRKRYCCLDCRDARGKKHAPRCQKHKPL